MNFEKIKKEAVELAASLSNFNVGFREEARTFCAKVLKEVDKSDSKSLSDDKLLECFLRDNGEVLLVFGFSPGFGVGANTAKIPLPDYLPEKSPDQQKQFDDWGNPVDWEED